MYPNQKIVWAEGVFLGQQHFQQWEKSLSEHQTFLHQHQFNKAYGVCQLTINKAQLGRHVCLIDSLVALMPDGRWLSFVSDQNEDELRVSLAGDETNVYLALPYSEVVDGISGYPKDELKKTAWQADYRACKDLYDPSREREVLYAKQRFFLTSDKSYESSCCLIKIAKCHRAGGSGYTLSQYIPPLINLGASLAAYSYVTALASAVNDRIKQLERRFLAVPAIAVRDSSVLSYSLILLSMLAKYHAKLMTFEQRTQTCPQALHELFSEFLCELSVCCQGKLADIMPFDRNRLDEIFRYSTVLIHGLLETINPVENKQLKLHKQSDNYYRSDDVSTYFNTGDYLYLEVSEYHEDDAWATRFERGVKLGAADKIDDIYASAVAGVSLKYIKRPPSAISIKPGCEYFQVLCEGDFWQQVLDDGRLGILKGKEFSSVEINLIVVEG